MRVVVDTNVVVSGLLSPHGPPAQIVRWLAAGQLQACFDGAILAEYREVLLRPALGLHPERVGELMRQIVNGGALVSAPPLPCPLPDPDDEPFLDVALAARARYLVTGHLQHFPASARSGVDVVRPAEFVQAARGELSAC